VNSQKFFAGFGGLLQAFALQKKTPVRLCVAMVSAGDFSEPFKNRLRYISYN
jgi:hypothetical protein